MPGVKGNLLAFGIAALLVILLGMASISGAEAAPLLVHDYDELNVFDACQYYTIKDFDQIALFTKDTLKTYAFIEERGEVLAERWDFLATVTVQPDAVDWSCKQVPKMLPNMSVEYTSDCTPVPRQPYTVGVWLPFREFVMASRSVLREVRVRHCATFAPQKEGKTTGYTVDMIPRLEATIYPHMTWYNTSWSYKKQITIQNANASDTLYANWTINISIDTTDGSKFQADCDDLRIVCNDSYEIARNVTKCGLANTQVWFPNPINISPGTSNTDCHVYYGNPTATAPSASLTDYTDIFSGTYWQLRPYTNSFYPLEFFNVSVINDTITPVVDGRESKQNGYKYLATACPFGQCVRLYPKVGVNPPLNNYSIQTVAKNELDATTDFTISVWLMFNFTDMVGDDVIIDNRYPPSEYGITIWTNTVGQLLFYINGPGAGSVGCATTAATMPIYNFTWMHFIFTGNSTGCATYINGVNKVGGTAAAAQTGYSVGGIPTAIGDRYNAADYNNGWNGWFDNLEFSNRTLTKFDIDTKYYYPINPPTTLGGEEANANPPDFYGLSVNVTNGSAYTPGVYYMFKSNWTNDGPDAVLLGWGGTNLTASNSSDVEFYVRLPGMLGATNTTYFWCGNSSGGSWNCTPSYTYQVVQQPSNPLYLTLNGSRADFAMGENETAVADASSYYTSCGNITAHLDGEYIEVPLSDEYLAGNYTFNVNTTGNTNFTLNLTGEIWALNVTTTPPPPPPAPPPDLFFIIRLGEKLGILINITG